MGAVCVRLEAGAAPGGGARAYVATLAVRAAYRGRGLGRALVRGVVAGAGEDPGITHACLHVHEANAAALALYTSLGFEVVGVLPNYYPRLSPPGAVVLQKELRGEGWAGEGGVS